MFNFSESYKKSDSIPIVIMMLLVLYATACSRATLMKSSN